MSKTVEKIKTLLTSDTMSAVEEYAKNPEAWVDESAKAMRVLESLRMWRALMSLSLGGMLVATTSLGIIAYEIDVKTRESD